MKKFYSVLFLFTFVTGIFAQNLVLNPGFEDWDDVNTPTSWTKVESVDQEATEVHSGTYSAKHTGGTSDLTQDIDVVAGQLYEVSLWYKVVENDGSDSRIWCVWLDSNGDGLFDDTQPELRGPDNGYLDNNGGAWTEYKVTVTAPATAAKLSFEVRTYSGAVTYWDDFSVVAVSDESAPVFDAGYPAADNVDETEFDLLAQLDEPSTVYYVVLENDATAPTVEEVKAGTGSAGAAAIAAGSFAAGTSETAETITGLTLDVSYDVYVVAEDDEDTPNVQDAVSLVEVTTMTPPTVILNAGFDTDLTPFTAVSVLGDQEWDYDDYSGDGGYAKASGYSGGAQDNDDYLISPAINLDGSTSNMMSFISASNYSGPSMQVLISTDFSGTYDAASVGSATWTDITSEFTLSGGGWAWTESGAYDLSLYSGTAYVAFRYQSNTTDGAATWEVDNFMITGYIVLGSDASLSDLQVDGTTIEGFDVATYNYTVELPAGTTDVPPVTATPTDENATVEYSPATDLTGDLAARTTAVIVTAQDGETLQTYSVVFNPVLEVATLADLRAAADDTRKFKVTGEVFLSFQQSYRNKKYVQDATGGVEIDDNPGAITTTYEIGDGITGLEGYVDFYNGLMQFYPSADPGAASSTGNELDILVATPDEIDANLAMYESRLVRVENGTIDEADGSATFENGSNYTLTTANGSMVLRVHFYSTSLTGEIIPDSANVTGIVIQYNGTSQLSPRSSEDVVELIKYVPSSDATLSDLMVDGVSVQGFTAAQLSYFVSLPAGTTDVPEVTAETTDENASVSITDATDLSGDAAARTTSIEVTAEDGTTMKTYTIEFTVEVSTSYAIFDRVQVYPVPATEILYLNNIANVERIAVVDITGSKVMEQELRGESQASIDVSSFNSGVYFIRLTGAEGNGIVRFVKQ